MFKIFYIDKEKFLRSTLEGLAKNLSDIEVYTLESSDDCFFRIKDFKADLIFVDIESIIDQPEFFETLRSNFKTACVTTGDPSKLLKEYRNDTALHIEKPLDVESIIEKLQSCSSQVGEEINE